MHRITHGILYLVLESERDIHSPSPTEQSQQTSPGWRCLMCPSGSIFSKNCKNDSPSQRIYIHRETLLISRRNNIISPDECSMLSDSEDTQCLCTRNFTSQQEWKSSHRSQSCGSPLIAHSSGGLQNRFWDSRRRQGKTSEWPSIRKYSCRISKDIQTHPDSESIQQKSKISWHQHRTRSQYKELI